MNNPIVSTIYGKVRGITENGVHSFKGIPYGEPTDGLNRFMPPALRKPWAGIKETTHYGPSSWQVVEGFNKFKFDLLGAAGVDSMSEDCLFLNVWTPGINDNGKRPVMVWVHGGGYFEGSGNASPNYDGASLAKTQDVVLVTVNHRLGVFGYLHLGEIGGNKYASSGNVGMLDLVAALQWVHDNISEFGGDPGNVTIFGQSGGGGKVCVLMAMPAAKGLFHHAILESGVCLKGKTIEEATQVSYEFLGLLGVRPNNIDILHKLRADMIYRAWMALPPVPWIPTGKLQFHPVLDGKAIPFHPFHPSATPTASDVSLLIGTNRDEMNFMLYNDPHFGKFGESDMRDGIVSSLKGRLIDITPEQVENLISVYRHTRPGSTPNDMLIAIGSDIHRSISIRIAERKIAGGSAPVYMYLLTWESPALDGKLKACHSLEIPFVFNNVEPTIGLIGNAPERFALAKSMSGAWAAFARKGDPNHEGIPRWPAYTEEKRATMVFNTECRVENDPYREERLAWNEII